MKRIYVVTENTDKGAKQHLVNAGTQAQALAAIVKPRFEVSTPTPAQMHALAKQGIEIVEV